MSRINSGGEPAYPITRMRRLRRSSSIRDLFQETRVSVRDLIYPIFVQDEIDGPLNIDSMPDIKRIPISNLADEIQEIIDLGIRGIILFGIPSNKSDDGNSAYSNRGIVQRSIKLVRQNFGERVALISDVCLCQYTIHGQCGIVSNGNVDNDKSIGILAKVAVSHAKAGADIVAPSAMMDGQVGHIRTALDESGFSGVAIMGYSAKHASSLYAPFRDASSSAPRSGDRTSYQLPFYNRREAIREIELDIREGADIVMIKPAIPYLDIIYQARKITNLPICAYSVSGEYSLIKAAAAEGWIDENNLMTEFITSIKRAGSDIIITYHAKKMASLLNNNT
jgi:porphobilinogen synthase